MAVQASAQSVKKGAGKRRRASGGLNRRYALWGVLCAGPAILGFLLWQAIPILGSFALGFSEWSIVGTPEWTAGSNYIHMFTKDPLFWKSLTVTATYAAISVPLRIIIALLVAMALNQRVVGLPIFRTIFYVPSIVPGIASSFIWLWLFNPDFGLFNAILRGLGLPRLMWVYSSDTALLSLILMSMWSIGGTMIIFLAGLQGVPRHLYEAVEVDGGNWRHRFWHVTLPMMTPTIFFNLVLGMIGAFQTFTEGYILTKGGPHNATLFYVLYLYNKAFRQMRMGYASALGWVLLVVIAVFSSLIFRSSHLWVYYEGEPK